MKLRKLYVGMGLAVGLGLAGQAQATFLIDDFNTATLYEAVDNTPGSVGVPPAPADPIDGTNIVMTKLLPGTEGPTIPVGWSRSVSANLSSGDAVSTQVCPSCAAGHFIEDAASSGFGSWIYEGPPLDLLNLPDGGYVTGEVGFEYAADLDDASVLISVTSEFGQSVAFWDELPNTGGSDPSNLTEVEPKVLIGNVNYAAVTGVVITVSGLETIEGGLDFTIDNVAMAQMPIPGTLALMALGLAGMGWRRRADA